MTNPFYNPSGNPGTGSEGLSSLMRSEFVAIGVAFDVMPRITTTGLFNTVFNQLGNYTFTLPGAPGTLAMLVDVGTETTRATTAEALLAPKASPALTGVPVAPTAAPGTNTTQLATTAFDAAAVLVETTRATAAEGVNATTAGNANGRNLVDNGRFNVHQRGLGPWTANGATADRWVHASVHSNGSFSDTLQNFSDLNRTVVGDEGAQVAYVSAVIGGSGAGDYDIIVQAIEGVRRTGAKTVTVSFWAYGTVGSKIGVEIAQNFGTGGSPSATVFTAGGAVTLTAAFVRYSVTVALPSLSGKTLGSNGDDSLQLYLWLSAGSTFTARSSGIGVQTHSPVIWGVQVEIAAAATSVEAPHPDIELAACQRHYQAGAFDILGYQSIGGAFGVTQQLVVAMRASPTVASAFTTTTNATGSTVAGYGVQAVIPNCSAAVTGSVQMIGTFTASAELI